MIIETYSCDKCKRPITDSSGGVYTLSHESIAGNAFFGDNRIPRDINFCFECFDRYLVPLITNILNP